MTEANKEGQEDSGFTLISAKEQQKRDSIMNELYNDMSSSDDEEEENSTANSEKTVQKSTPASSASEKTQASSAAAATNVNSAAASDNNLVNPFKRQITAAESEALKELYGEDYEEPIGFEDTDSNEQKGKLAEMLSAKLSSWFGRAKGKYTEEMDNPDSKVSQVMRKLAVLNEEIKGDKLATTFDQKTESLMVSMGMDQPLQQTEFGMANPYRTGLAEFLEQEEEKDREEREALEAEERKQEEAWEAEQAAEKAALERQAEEKKREEEKTKQEAQNQFQFTIGGADDDDDEDEDLGSKDNSDTANRAGTNSAQEVFNDSDDDDDDDKSNQKPASNEGDAKKVQETATGQEESKDIEGGQSAAGQEESKEEEKKQDVGDEPGSPNPYDKDNIAMVKGGTIWLKDYELVQARKEVKRPSALRSMVSQVREERLLTLKNGVLYSIKRLPTKNIATKSIGRFFASKMPENQQEQLSQEDRGIIKGCNELSRLFKIDVVGKGKSIMSGFQTEIELILHLVNKERNPTGKPEVKRYQMKSETSTKQLLARLQKEAKEKSSYYQ